MFTNYHMKTLSCSVLVFLCGLASLRTGETNDLDSMQGSWLVVSLIEKGKAVPGGELETLEIVIDKDTFTTFEKGKVVVKYRIKLEPTKSPKQIDLTYLVGEDKGKTEPGIYTFAKDQLKVCLDEDKKGRPMVFEGKETQSYSVIVLKKKPK